MFISRFFNTLFDLFRFGAFELGHNFGVIVKDGKGKGPTTDGPLCKIIKKILLFHITTFEGVSKTNVVIFPEWHTPGFKSRAGTNETKNGLTITRLNDLTTE